MAARLGHVTTQTPSAQRHRVVIIGGGFGGLHAARALRHAPVDITLIDRRNYHLFQPLLYQVATGSLSPGEIATPLRAVLRRQRNIHVMLGEVADVDLDARMLTVHPPAEVDGPLSVPYDSLIVAAGMRNSYFGNDQWRDSAPALKDLEDALDIRARILLAFEAAETESDPEVRERWLNFVVVGGGPTGVEMAGQIAEIARDTMKNQFATFDPARARVHLLEGADRILLAFDEKQSAHATRDLEQLGVEVRTGSMVSEADPAGVDIVTRGVTERIPANTVIWAAGVTAVPFAARLAECAGVTPDRAGRVPVDTTLSLADHPEVMVVGDMASVADQRLPGVAPVAMQAGRYAGRRVAARLEGEETGSFVYQDKGSLATIGRARAVATIGGMKFTGFIAWWLWLAVHLFYLIGFQNRFIVMTRWSWSFLTRGRGARLITGSRSVIGDDAGDTSPVGSGRSG